MRDFLHISCLFLVFAFLATRFPSEVPFVPPQAAPASFASFVTLSPAAHAAQLEAARTSWQVRSKARGRPSIGRLDADIPLLSETLPPPAAAGFPYSPLEPVPFPEPDLATFAFLPPTAGAEMPDFAIRAFQTQGHQPPEGRTGRPPAFDRREMLSTKDYRTLKELLK